MVASKHGLRPAAPGPWTLTAGGDGSNRPDTHAGGPGLTSKGTYSPGRSGPCVHTSRGVLTFTETPFSVGVGPAARPRGPPAHGSGALEAPPAVGAAVRPRAGG